MRGDLKIFSVGDDDKNRWFELGECLKFVSKRANRWLQNQETLVLSGLLSRKIRVFNTDLRCKSRTYSYFNP